MSVIYIKQI